MYEAYFSKFPFFFNFEFWNVFLPLLEGTERALESNPKKNGTNEPSKEYNTGKPRYITVYDYLESNESIIYFIYSIFPSKLEKKNKDLWTGRGYFFPRSDCYVYISRTSESDIIRVWEIAATSSSSFVEYSHRIYPYNIILFH